MSTRCRLVFSFLALAATTALPLLGQASSSSSAFGESVDLALIPTVGGGIQISSGPVPTASGSAPPAYSDQDTQVSVTLGSPLTGQILATGLLAVSASSTVPASDSVTAQATVDDLDFDLIGLLTLDATTVRSTATVTSRTRPPRRLRRVMLDNADLVGANLTGVSLPGSTLRAAWMNDAVLDGADLRGVDWEAATVNGISCEGTRFNGMKIGQGLRGDKLAQVTVKKAILVETKAHRNEVDASWHEGVIEVLERSDREA